MTSHLAYYIDWRISNRLCIPKRYHSLLAIKQIESMIVCAILKLSKTPNLSFLSAFGVRKEFISFLIMLFQNRSYGLITYVISFCLSMMVYLCNVFKILILQYILCEEFLWIENCMLFQKNFPSVVTRKGGKEANKTNECKHTGRKCPKKVSCLFNTWLEHEFWLFLLSFSFRAKSGLTGIELGLKVCQHFEN